MINALYNIVDRMYIGNLPGQQAAQSIAALGVSLPLIVVISAFGSLVGIAAPLWRPSAWGRTARKRPTAL